MTYNAIQSIITNLVAQGKAVRFHPRFVDHDETESREIVLVRSVDEWLRQKDRTKPIDYKTNVQEHLARFVLGGYVDNRNYMKSWKLDIFEIRVQLEKRGNNTRIFGGFLFQNIFVCTNYHMRGKFKSEKDWNNAIDRALERWRVLFQDRVPLKSQPFRGCVTFNAYDNTLSEAIK